MSEDDGIIEAIWDRIHDAIPDLQVGDVRVDKELVWLALILGLVAISLWQGRQRRGRRAGPVGLAPTGVPYPPPPMSPGGSGPADPVRTRTYSGRTPDEAAYAFQLDAAEAARAGFTPTSQAWQGTMLTVTYQRTAPQARGRSTRAPALVLLGGAALIAVGCLLPWFVSGSGTGRTTLAGIDTDDGEILLAAAGAIAVLGLLAGLGGVLRALVTVSALLVSLFVLITSVVDARDIAELTSALPGGGLGNVGIGLWAVIAGAVTALVGAIWGVLRR